MNERLDFLVRQNNGKDKLSSYKQLFEGFNLKGLTFIDLEESDKVISQIKSIFPGIELESDELDDEFKTSVLLTEILEKALATDYCYIFTDDVYECGMFKATTLSAIEACLDVAFLAYDNTCFLTDSEFRFSFTINYYDELNVKEPELYNKYEVQRKVRKEIN